MIHEIDLHGLTHQEAIKKVENDLIQASLSRFYEVRIITGKSRSMRKTIIKEVLDPQNFFYYIPIDNEGEIIVVDNDLFS
jgi:dsDNA-specific endonuclease/ATPase MutS2